MTTTVIGIADSDSYLKWAAGTLDRLAGADATLVLVHSHLTPNLAQRRAALALTRWRGRDVRVLTAPAVWRLLRTRRPDAVLVATTGPIAQLLVRGVAHLPFRPVVITGLPGMSLPATEPALRYRTGADVFVVHSLREREEFARLAGELAVPLRFVVNRLPFLDAVPAAAEPLRRVVFAAQAKFPAELEQREAILLALGRLAASRTDLDVVVKLRALSGETQTHQEEFGYDEIWRRLAGEPGVARIRAVAGAMAEQLAPGTALATVSSTAVIEAVARGLPGLVLTDFGIGDANLTGAYANSGLFGDLADLESARFRAVDAEWARENYLHDEPDELPPVLVELTGPDHARVLARISPGTPVGGRRRLLREAMRTTLPPGVTDRIRRVARRAAR